MWAKVMRSSFAKTVQLWWLMLAPTQHVLTHACEEPGYLTFPHLWSAIFIVTMWAGSKESLLAAGFIR
jgi:hypothetical protein